MFFLPSSHSSSNSLVFINTVTYTHISFASLLLFHTQLGKPQPSLIITSHQFYTSTNVAEHHLRKTHNYLDGYYFKFKTMFKWIFNVARQSCCTFPVHSVSHSPEPLFHNFTSLLKPSIPPPLSSHFILDKYSSTWKRFSVDFHHHVTPT